MRSWIIATANHHVLRLTARGKEYDGKQRNKKQNENENCMRYYIASFVLFEIIIITEFNHKRERSFPTFKNYNDCV